jgi:hypothetical protein
MPTVKRDSPIFADTKIGTVPEIVTLQFSGGVVSDSSLKNCNGIYWLRAIIVEGFCRRERDFALLGTVLWSFRRERPVGVF